MAKQASNIKHLYYIQQQRDGEWIDLQNRQFTTTLFRSKKRAITYAKHWSDFKARIIELDVGNPHPTGDIIEPNSND